MSGACAENAGSARRKWPSWRISTERMCRNWSAASRTSPWMGWSGWLSPWASMSSSYWRPSRRRNRMPGMPGRGQSRVLGGSTSLFARHDAGVVRIRCRVLLVRLILRAPRRQSGMRGRITVGSASLAGSAGSVHLRMNPEKPVQRPVCKTEGASPRRPESGPHVPETRSGFFRSLIERQ